MARTTAFCVLAGFLLLAACARAQTQWHTVKAGETFSSIAKRYETTVDTLVSLNNLSSTTIRCGQRLLVRKAETHSGTARATKQTGTAKKAPAASRITGQYYTVKKGDTLSQISARAGVSVAALKKLNGLRSDIIREGQQLKVRSAPPPPPHPPDITPSPIMQVREKVYYKVVATDTVETIAARFGIDGDALRSANLLREGDALRPGQVLVIPSAVPEPDSAETETGNGINLRDAVVREAYSFLNAPYRSGGTGKDGVDCAGFTWGVFRKVGINLPRTSLLQYLSGEVVSLEKALPGDLVFFRGQDAVNHVGIYLGDNRYIHASSAEKKVTVSRLEGPYFTSCFAGVKRYLTETGRAQEDAASM